MKSVRNKAAIQLAALVLTGCTLPPVQSGVSASPAVDGMQEQRAQVRDAQKVISYFNKLNPPLVRQDKGGQGQAPKLAPIQLTIKDALAKFVPAEYQVTLTKDVNTQTVIVYDPSLPWIEAMGKGLAGASLEMNANLYKRAMLVKHFETSLADVIDKHVPGDYKVFTDAEISIDSMVRYDERQHWADALSESGAQSGLDITANLTRKLIVIKPMVTTNKDDIKKP
jgi:hypothetical protein